MLSKIKKPTRAQLSQQIMRLRDAQIEVIELFDKGDMKSLSRHVDACLREGRCTIVLIK